MINLICTRDIIKTIIFLRFFYKSEFYSCFKHYKSKDKGTPGNPKEMKNDS